MKERGIGRIPNVEIFLNDPRGGQEAHDFIEKRSGGFFSLLPGCYLLQSKIVSGFDQLLLVRKNRVAKSPLRSYQL